MWTSLVHYGNLQYLHSWKVLNFPCFDMKIKQKCHKRPKQIKEYSVKINVPIGFMLTGL